MCDVGKEEATDDNDVADDTDPIYRTVDNVLEDGPDCL